MEHGRRLITPITQSLYEEGGKLEYAPLDDRLIWTISEWDSWKKGDQENHSSLYEDSRWKSFFSNKDKKRRIENRDKAKDIWATINSFYTTKKESKKKNGQFIMPDSKKTTGGRLFSRSRQNALRYGYR